jgi:hypothetical protein
MVSFVPVACSVVAGLPGRLLIAVSFAVAIDVQGVTGGTSPWLLPLLRRGSGPRPCRGSAGPPAATTRHLRPMGTAAHACLAAHCRPQTRCLTGAGSGGCRCSRGPDRDPAVPRGRAGSTHRPALRTPQAGDCFCAAVYASSSHAFSQVGRQTCAAPCPRRCHGCRLRGLTSLTAHRSSLKMSDGV